MQLMAAGEHVRQFTAHFGRGSRDRFGCLIAAVVVDRHLVGNGSESE